VQQKPRQIAARILFEWEVGNQFAESILREHLTQSNLKPIDRHMVQEMVFGVIRNLILLDSWIDEKATRPPGKTRARTMLRLGLYQIAFMDRIPEHAAVHETVATARDLRLHSQSGFINAILRGFLRDKEAILKRLETWKTMAPSKAYSHPEWLIHKWKKQFGDSSTIALLDWNNQIPSTYARWNPLCGSVETLESLWNKEGVARKEVSFPWSQSMKIYKITSFPTQPDKLESFKSGLFYVQDPSTLLAVQMLDAKPGESILDTCAAPGGKACAMAAQMDNQGTIVAADPDPGRLRRMQENTDRLAVKNTTITKSIKSISKDEAMKFDAILIDAPCSNSGVMRRRLDVRWRITPAEIRNITEQQRAIFQENTQHLKQGGRLIYSTCSLEPEENGQIVEQFLKENKDFKLEHEQQLTPFEHGVDGAYAAKLVFKPTT
jgi:16S rRNA (cytosine967-C5)-methyltransferase